MAFFSRIQNIFLYELMNIFNVSVHIFHVLPQLEYILPEMLVGLNCMFDLPVEIEHICFEDLIDCF